MENITDYLKLYLLLICRKKQKIGTGKVRDNRIGMSRNISKRIDLNDLEAKILKMKADQCHLSEADYLRELIMNSQPVEAPFYDQISDGNGVRPYVWGEADLAVGSVRVLGPNYAGKLVPLPKVDGVLLEVEE